MNERLKKLRRALAKEKLDGLLLRVFEGDSQNVFYLSGFSGSTAILIVTPKRAFIIADGRYWIRAAKEAPNFELAKVQHRKTLIPKLNETLVAAGLGKNSRIGFEANNVSFQLACEWKRHINAKLVAVSHLVERFRQYKDPQEIAHLKKACHLTSIAFSQVLPLIQPGMTELEVALEIDMGLRRAGAINNSFPTIVASGSNSAMAHHTPGVKKLRPGEPVVLDFGGLFPGGYCSDITRTVFVPGDKPKPKIVEIYNIVLTANKLAFKALKPGMMWRDYDKVARDYITQRGYGQYFTHGLGHSLGLYPHDPYDYEGDPFAVGTVITNEPGIYVEGLGGVRIEDDLVVTKNGAQRLTNAPYWDF